MYVRARAHVRSCMYVGPQLDLPPNLDRLGPIWVPGRRKMRVQSHDHPARTQASRANLCPPATKTTGLKHNYVGSAPMITTNEHPEANIVQAGMLSGRYHHEAHGSVIPTRGGSLSPHCAGYLTDGYWLLEGFTYLTDEIGIHLQSFPISSLRQYVKFRLAKLAKRRMKEDSGIINKRRMKGVEVPCVEITPLLLCGSMRVPPIIPFPR